MSNIRPWLVPALLAAQSAHVAFLLLHDWLPLGKLNDVKALLKADSGAKIFVTTLVQTAPFAVGLAGSFCWYGQRFPVWLVWYLWISYGALFVGELQAWWIPYLLIRQPKRAARYQVMFSNTAAFLPEHNGIRPNTLHVLLHTVTVAMLLLLWLGTHPGPLGT